MKTVYLDYAATTPVDARVLKAMLPYFCEQYGNPSSLYSFGREARQAVSQARRQLASLLGAEPDEIFFTSGGSESDNWVLRSLSEEALRHGGGHIITTKVEHHAVLRACEALPSGIEVTYLDVDSEGRVQPEAVESSLRPDTFLVSVMAANN
ncbi:MAG: aminotransferase class V-fold PLP-dependent enzyme, partial [Mitsuokella jalaludinii]|nr:aminotransferase class V-fold PLP-dependent enzyme [Mitsuokella jalaludinii]